MSKFRPECRDSNSQALPDDTAYFLIHQSVCKRRALIHGALHRGKYHCAIGAFWADNPKASLHSSLIDEVAAVNDSVPKTASPQERWKKVTGWLRWKMKVLATQRAST